MATIRARCFDPAMDACSRSLALRRAVLASAMLALGMVAAGPTRADAPMTAPLAVAGRTLRIPPPKGMVTAAVPASRAGAVLELLPDVGKPPEPWVCFAPESLLAPLRRDKRQADGFAPLAIVWAMSFEDGISSWPSDTSEDVRTLAALFGSDLATALQPLEADPEGVADLPVELPGRAPIALRFMDLGETGLGTVQADPVGLRTPGAAAARWQLKAAATIVVDDRELHAVMFIRDPPSTGAIAALRRQFIGWMGDILFENHSRDVGERTRGAIRSEGRGPRTPPKPGESDVDQLPEAVLRVAPEYPEAARERGISGTVMVGALVGKDGRVKETRIEDSIPGLDESAASAVRLWRFIPARKAEAPVAVWVAVPVKFSLD